MRIGIDARLYHQTGVGRYIRNLLIHLALLDKKNVYTIFARKEDVATIKKDVNRAEWNFVETDITWHSMAEQIEFPQVVTNQNLDLVHFPYFSVPIFYKGKFVVTIHDLIIDHYPTGKASTLPLPLYYGKHLAYKQILRLSTHKSRKIITPSDATKQEIVDHYGVPSEKVIVTYEGVDAVFQQLGKGEKIGYPYFLYVGNAYPHKNLERLVKAFKDLTLENNNIRLLLVGKEDYFYKNLKSLVAKEGLEDKVIFKGFVADKELAVLYNQAEAVIVPSLMEGFALPVLEALSQNALVLASDIPAIREICSDAVIYFNPKSIPELEIKMKEILENKDKKSYKDLKAQAQVCLKKYSWEKMARETLKVYEETG